MGLGFAQIMQMACRDYGVLLLASGQTGPPSTGLLGLIGDYGFLFSLWLIGLVLLLFPDGRLSSKFWRIVAWTTSIAVGLMAAGTWMLPGESGTLPATWSGVVSETSAQAVEPAGSVLLVVLFAGVPLGVLSVLLRYRRASGIERRQIKWLALAAVFSLPAWAIDLPGALDQINEAIAGVLLPAAMAIAIFRYRLYDIDRLISRTVSYGLVAAVLAAVYLGGVAALGAVVGSDNPLAVAGATLAAAALFTPVRRRVQGGSIGDSIEPGMTPPRWSPPSRDGCATRSIWRAHHRPLRRRGGHVAPGDGVAGACRGGSSMRRAALVVWLASIVSWSVAAVLGAYAPSVGASPVLEAVELFAFVILGTFGYLIARRQPTNAVAWLAIIPGLVFPLEALLSDIAHFALTNLGPDHRVTAVAGWCVLWVWIPGPYSIPFLLALYPDGQPASPRWRPLLWLLWTLVALTFLISAFAPGPVDEELLPGLNNPLGIAGFTAHRRSARTDRLQRHTRRLADRRHLAHFSLSTRRYGGAPTDQVACMGRRRRGHLLRRDHPRRRTPAALLSHQHRLRHPGWRHAVRRRDAPWSVRDRSARQSRPSPTRSWPSSSPRRISGG